MRQVELWIRKRIDEIREQQKTINMKSENVGMENIIFGDCYLSIEILLKLEEK